MSALFSLKRLFIADRTLEYSFQLRYAHGDVLCRVVASLPVSTVPLVDNFFKSQISRSGQTPKQRLDCVIQSFPLQILCGDPRSNRQSHRMVAMGRPQQPLKSRLYAGLESSILATVYVSDVVTNSFIIQFYRKDKHGSRKRYPYRWRW